MTKGSGLVASPAGDNEKKRRKLFEDIYCEDESRRQSAWGSLLEELQSDFQEVARAEMRGRTLPTLSLEDLTAEVIGGFYFSYRTSEAAVAQEDRLTTEHYKSLLHAIGRNKILAHYARLEREKKHHSGVNVDKVLRTSPSASQWARGKELHDALSALMSVHLSPLDCRIFRERVVNDLSIQEIKEKLRIKISADALRKKIERLRKRLKRVLSPEMLRWLPEPRGKTRKHASPDKLE